MIWLEAKYLGVAEAVLAKPAGVVQARRKVLAGASDVGALEAHRPPASPKVEGREAKRVNLARRRERGKPRPCRRVQQNIHQRSRIAAIREA